MPRFEIKLEPLELPLRHAFTITRGSRTTARNLRVELRDGDLSGLGEFAPNPRYDETVETVAAAVESFDPDAVPNPNDLVGLHHHLMELFPHQGAVRAGLEMAFADLLGKRLDVPLHRLWNAPSTRGPVTSFTIGIDSEEMIRQKVVEAAAYPVLKIKLGTDHDRDILRIIREVTDKEVWVDANEGWTDLDQAVDFVRFLAGQNVSMVEQPMPAGMHEEMTRLKIRSPLPLMADEGFTGEEPLEKVVQAYHGINLKLMKTGGMVPALQHLWKARQLGMKVMVGCMLESSIANTAAAIVALWADCCDLDSHLLISDDPFRGLRVDVGGFVNVNDRPGLGVMPVS